jgi:alpha-L-fucosidase
MVPSLSKPTAKQLEFQGREFGMFCHFGINSFYGKEWSDGTLSPEGFDPKGLDAFQWVEAAKYAGMRYLVFTAKHHDGFCLWPTATTDYSVKSSPFRNGKGDVVKEISKACSQAGLPFGIYLSPWDRHDPCYKDAKAYDDFYCRQLTELCTQYGEIAYLWFDGAGTEGREYHWDSILSVIDRYHPNAMIFGTTRPTVRWIGNEDGIADDPCLYHGASEKISSFSDLTRTVNASYLVPECDAAIRQHWFWQPDDLHTLKSEDHLLGIWYRSVGLGANLLLNVPPDRTGCLDSLDLNRLYQVRSELRRRFSNPSPAILDRVEDGYVLTFSSTKTIDHLELRENLEAGQRIFGYEIHLGTSSVLSGATVGHRKIHVFPRETTKTIRIRFHKRSHSGASLVGASGYLTGCEVLPTLGPRLNYDAWDQKADVPAGFRR